MKWIRRLFFALLLFVALLAVGMFYADSLARAGIEAGGTEALGVATTVEECDVGFFSGSFAMKGLDIANPEGYDDLSFLTLGDASVEVSAWSLMSDKIEIPALTLREIRVNLVHGVGGSNYGEIMENLEKFQGDGDDDTSEGKRFVIRRLLVEDVVVKVVPLRELFTEVSIPIDRIELKDVGSDSNKGVLLADVAGIVVEAILTRASVSGALPAMVRGTLKGQLGELSGLRDAGAKMLNDLGKQLGNMPGGVGDTIKDLTNRLPGIGK